MDIKAAMDTKSSSATLPAHGTPQIDPGDNRSREENGLPHSGRNRQNIREMACSAWTDDSNRSNHSGKSRQKKRSEIGRSEWRYVDIQLTLVRGTD